MLGGSETTSAADELFEQVTKRHKIYAKLPAVARLRFDPPRAETGLEEHGARKAGSEGQQTPDMGKEADRIVLAHYAPPGVVVNAALEIVQFRGHPSRYLEPAPGEASLNLFRMARQELVIDLRAAVHQARKSGAAARKQGLEIQINGQVCAVDIEVAPLGGGAAAEGYYLILFDDVTARRRPGPETAPPRPRQRAKSGATVAEKELAALRKELAAAQEDLHSIIEELEASNEELQSANEEILSANEELQSTNEELETAKEEMEATNEELTTVNEELHNRNAELSLANNDLQNLIAVSEVVMVMVGQDLRIRRITPTAQNALNLIPADIGRPLGNIKTNLKVPDLESLIMGVIDSITPVERQVQDLQGRWYSMRIRPYRTENSKIEGAVMILVDIDTIKRGEESEEIWRALVDPLPDFILSADPEGKVLFLNRTRASLARQVTVGKNIHDFMDPQDHANLTRCLRKVMASGKAARFETRPASGSPGESVVTQVSPIKSHGRVVALTMTTVVPSNAAE
jgi:two-component system CheB/CheR fusion protein